MPDMPNWGDSTAWQYWVIDVVRRYEREKGYDTRPIGMTMQFPVSDQTKVNAPLYDSRAEWISPGYDDEIFSGGRHPMAPGSPPSRWFDHPPANDGRKVVISDTDHFAPGKGDALWAWKSFVRGHHTILMDFGIIAGVDPSQGGRYDAFEPARWAMGDTLRYARRMNLIAMTPRGDLASTGYALANPGREYLVLQPNGGPFTVTIDAGRYAVEWHSLNTRETKQAPTLDLASNSTVDLTPPFDGPAVAYLTAG